MTPVVSVVVATRDRAAKLSQLFDGFRALRTDARYPWELIVVDNASADGTSAAVAAVRDLPVVGLVEPRAGKGVALNTALARCRGTVVAFTDDDCVVDPGWVQAIAEAFERDPGLAAIGGRVELYDPADLPTAIRTSTVPHDVRSPEDVYDSVIGANMAFRRSALERLGGFDTRMGPGGMGPSDEDTDLVYRTIRTGGRVRYVPEALVRHAHGRRTPADAQALARRYLRGRGAFYCKFILAGDWRVIRMAARELVRSAGQPATFVFRIRHLAAGAWRWVRVLLGPARAA